MKNLFFLFLLAISGALFAQPGFPPPEDGPGHGRDHEKIKAARIGFLTEELELTADEAAKFWPVFNEYESQKKAIHEKYKPEVKPDEMNDQQANDFLDNMLKAKEEHLALEKKYLPKFKSVLPVQKVVKLGKADRDFRRKLLRQMHEKRRDGKGRHGDMGRQNNRGPRE